MSKKRSKEPKDTGPQPRPWVYLEFTVADAAPAFGSQRPEGQPLMLSSSDTVSSKLASSGRGVDNTAPNAAEAAASTQRYRFEFELMNDVCPRAAENFRQLVTGPVQVGEKKNPRSIRYEGTAVTRVTSEIIQGGDVTNSADGKGQASVYNALFDDEALGVVPHGYGALAMANSGPNTNGSQFYVCTAEAEAVPHLTRRHVCFGALLGGEDAVARLQQLHAALLAAADGLGGLVGPGGAAEAPAAPSSPSPSSSPSLSSPAAAAGFLPRGVASLTACGVVPRPPPSTATSPTPDIPK